MSSTVYVKRMSSKKINGLSLPVTFYKPVTAASDRVKDEFHDSC